MSGPARAVSHVGITVPDLEAAVPWYCDVFGLEPIMAPAEVVAGGGGPIDEICAEIFGAKFGAMKIAHLAAANGVAIELFQFVEPAYEAPDDNFAYWRGGPFHFAFVASDIEDLADSIVAKGGKRRSKVISVFGEGPVKACYCEDPWGTVIEIMSHSHERVYSDIPVSWS